MLIIFNFGKLDFYQDLREVVIKLTLYNIPLHTMNQSQVPNKAEAA